MRVLADFVFGDDATLCGAFLFEQGGILAGRRPSQRVAGERQAFRGRGRKGEPPCQNT